MKNNVFYSYMLIVGCWLALVGCESDRLKEFAIGPNTKLISPSTELIFPTSSLTGNESKSEVKANDFLAKGNGYEITIQASELQYADGSLTPVTYPFEVTVLQFRTPSQIILNQLHTVTGTSLLTSDGHLHISASKDGKALTLKPGGIGYNVQVSEPKYDSKMTLFDGEERSKGWVDWKANVRSTLMVKDNFGSGTGGYVLFPSQLGWLSMGYIYKMEDNQKTTISFDRGNVKTEDMLLYIYYPDQRSIVRVTTEKVDNMPKGQRAIVLAIVKSDEQKYYFYESPVQAINPATPVKLSLVPSSLAKIEASLREIDTKYPLDPTN